MPDENLPLPCQLHDSVIKDLKHEVFGNGRPGLKADVHELKVTMKVNLLWIKGVAILASIPTFWRILSFVAEKAGH